MRAARSLPPPHAILVPAALLQALVEEYEVAALDMRGFGESDRPKARSPQAGAARGWQAWRHVSESSLRLSQPRLLAPPAIQTSLLHHARH